MGQRVMCDKIGQVKSLSRFRPQELSASRNIEKEIAYRDGGSSGMCRIFDVTHASAFDSYARSSGSFFGSGSEFDSGDRRYGRERLTPKAERSNCAQVFSTADLRGS